VNDVHFVKAKILSSLGCIVANSSLTQNRVTSHLPVILPQPTKTPFNGFEKTLDERVGDLSLVEKCVGKSINHASPKISGGTRLSNWPGTAHMTGRTVPIAG
jgi:hypothetical protein